MVRNLRRAGSRISLIALYAVLAVAPAVVVVSGERPPPRFLADVSFVAAMVGFTLLALQFVTVARLRHLTRPFGIDVVMRYHQLLSRLVLVLLVAHPLLLLAEGDGFRRLVDPFTSPARVRLGQLALLLVVAVAGTAALRLRLGLSYEWWRLSHGAAAVIALSLALLHILAVGTWVSTTVERVVFAGTATTAIALYGWVRVIRPMLLLRRPWIVEEVVCEQGDTWTLTLRAEGHDGVHFGAGQFAWVTIGTSPFRLREHPFSFSSSATTPERVTFTVKELGDFTGAMSDLGANERAYVDGPFGRFTLEAHPGPGLVLIVGGVGIGPVMSILRTLRDAGSRTPIWLFDANDTRDDMVYEDDLEDLAGALPLEVVHVLSDANGSWAGEQGHIDAALLDRHLPAERADLQYFVCGPPPMMAAVEEALDELGIPQRRVHHELFDFV